MLSNMDYIIKKLYANIHEQEKFLGKLKEFNGTSNASITKFLKEVLSEEEDRFLVDLLYGDNGWYRKIAGYGYFKIKAAALSFELTHDRLFICEEQKEACESVLTALSDHEHEVLLSVYAKQKAATLKLLRNSKLTSMEVYRGIQSEEDKTGYFLGNVESWTEDRTVAYKFIGLQGYILSNIYDVNNIWITRKSAYKLEEVRPWQRRNAIQNEKEIIVENIEEILKKEKMFYFNKGAK